MFFLCFTDSTGERWVCRDVSCVLQTQLVNDGRVVTCPVFYRQTQLVNDGPVVTCPVFYRQTQLVNDGRVVTCPVFYRLNW